MKKNFGTIFAGFIIVFLFALTCMSFRYMSAPSIGEISIQNKIYVPLSAVENPDVKKEYYYKTSQVIIKQRGFFPFLKDSVILDQREPKSGFLYQD